MNESLDRSLARPVTLGEWLRSAEARLLARAGIHTSRLDSLVLASDELKCDKAWLLAHPEHNLPRTAHNRLDGQITRRSTRVPLAYIRGKQEFYGREFMVSPAVLIPRPETEALAELLFDLALPANIRLLDVGTGSGALAITAKLERTAWHVSASDISPDALAVARENAQALHADITFLQQDLLTAQPDHSLNVIIANLPYVDRTWERSAETDFEPALALYAPEHGLALIKKLIEQAASALRSSGYLLLEADPRQHQNLIDFACTHGFRLHATRDFVLAFNRRTT